MSAKWLFGFFAAVATVLGLKRRQEGRQTEERRESNEKRRESVSFVPRTDTPRDLNNNFSGPDDGRNGPDINDGSA